MAVFVVDISKWDGDVSIPKLKNAGVGAVIAKCGGGDVGIYTDSQWENNYAKCKAASMPIGAYWYLGATTVAKAKEEAAYCLKLLKGKKLEYPVYVDVEERAHQQMSVHQPGTLAKVILAFTDAIKAAGWMPGVYSWKWLLEPCGSKVAALEWWVCAWVKTKPCECGMWQFGGETNPIRSTTVAGYKNMDQSYAYRDYPSIIKAAGLNGYTKEATVALSVPEKIAQTAEHIAKHDAHGYSQPNRSGDGTTETITYSDGSKATLHGGDYDCSEMARVCANCAISGSYKKPITYMWTGSQYEEMTKAGFTRMSYSASKVRRGDVLWVEGHTGVALGDGKQADAHGDEYGGLSGPNKGDQTTHEIEVRSLRSWTYIYRYQGTSTDEEWFDVTQTLTFTRSARVYKQAKVATANRAGYTYKAGETVTIDGLLIKGGYVWGTYIGASTGARRYVILFDSKGARVK